MKALCKSNGMFRGIIRDEDTYNDVKNDKKDWKPHLKSKMTSVEIPYELFLRLLNLDRKQIPKKPYMDNENGIYEQECCPTCNRHLFPNEHHCRCGQALDWGEENETINR